MLPIQKQFITNRKTRPALRKREWYTIRQLKGVVAHWTANANRGADARANRNYFNTTTVYASAHYIVDDHSIIQCLPDHEVGYHVGGSFYRPIGEQIRENGLTPNYFLIGFEMCVNEDGDWNKTYQNSVELAQHLLNKYNFTVNELYRHYDITGKLCPRMMIQEADWQRFKAAVNKGLNFHLENPIKQGFINTPELNVRSGNGMQYPVIDVLHEGHPIEIYEQLGNWYRIGDNRWVHKHYVLITFSKKDGIVQDPTGLNVRTGPGMQHRVIDVIEDGTNVEIFEIDGRWYRIGVNRWVYGRLVQIVEVKTGRVFNADFLNVREGAGTNFPRVGRLDRGQLVRIFERKDDKWYRVGDKQWVYGAYVELID
ncbi:MAG: SH3 domain-containing protein [Bacteroidota bacterium]